MTDERKVQLPEGVKICGLSWNRRTVELELLSEADVQALLDAVPIGRVTPERAA